MNAEQIANRLADFVADRLTDDFVDGATENMRGGWFFDFDHAGVTYTVQVTKRGE
jgi:hypothetical protein